MGKDKEKTPKKPATRVRSFRLTQSESDLIDKLAAEYDVTPSHVMRLVMSSNIKKYFGDLKYMDHDQGVEIKKIITDIAEYLSKIRYELNRIGVNYNQDMKLRQAQKKFDELTVRIQRTSDITVLESLLVQRGNLEKTLNQLKATRSGNPVDINQVTQWLATFDNSAKKVSDALWHIRG